jgi:hypothetical protein
MQPTQATAKQLKQPKQPKQQPQLEQQQMLADMLTDMSYSSRQAPVQIQYTLTFDQPACSDDSMLTVLTSITRGSFT